jgi:PKD repeat protein
MKTKLCFLITLLVLAAFLTSCKHEPIACFTYSSESLNNDENAVAGEIIQFANCSENAEICFWDFGDGITSTLTDPNHTFDMVGTYDVTLTVKNDEGTNAAVLEVKIEIPPPTACFTFTNASIEDGELPSALETIEFDNCSEYADSYKWDFGDGTTSTSINTEHEYQEAGTYTVILTVKNDNGSNQSSQDIEVQAFTASVTGTWEGNMILGADEYPIILELEQDGTELSGTFQFSDGSGLSTLDSDSEIDGHNVMIKFTIPDATYPLPFRFVGYINDDVDEMEGTYTISGYTASGTWTVFRTDKKSDNQFIKRGLDDLIMHLKKE